MNWTESYACGCRVHCEACRNKEDGWEWRESLRKAFILPDDETDFECPHGIPWGAGPQTEVMLEALRERDALLETVYKEYERIGAICNGCEENMRLDGKPLTQLCDFAKLKVCTRKRLIKNSLGPAKELIQCPKKLLYEEK